MSRIIVLLCIGATFAFAAHAGVTDATRGALWKVVQACVLNHSLTGAAFPCLEVNVADGADRGYVILRPPLGPPDLLLAPTKKIVGVEDPSLRDLEAPNYFEDAWNARKFLRDAQQTSLPHDGVALAVNSRQSRTQDQLHIHIGCLSGSARRSIQILAPALPTDRWISVGKPFHGPELWGRLLVAGDLANANPFRLVSEGWPGPARDRSQLLIMVVGIKLSEGREGFALLTSYYNPFGKHYVEDFLGGSSCP